MNFEWLAVHVGEAARQVAAAWPPGRALVGHVTTAGVFLSAAVVLAALAVASIGGG